MNCFFLFSFPENNLRNHIASVHKDKDKIYPCEFCENRFSEKRYLRRHMKNIHTEQIEEEKCEICGETFQFISHLQKHIDSAHQDLNIVYKCEFCDKRFNSIVNQANHVKYYHQNEKKFKCVSCDYETVFPSYLRKHLNTHGKTNNYMCVFCQDFFTNNDQLKSHVDEVHEGQIYYSCQLCAFTCRKNQSLQIHKLSKHKLPKNINQDMNDSTNETSKDQSIELTVSKLNFYA